MTLRLPVLPDVARGSGYKFLNDRQGLRLLASVASTFKKRERNRRYKKFSKISGMSGNTGKPHVLS